MVDGYVCFMALTGGRFFMGTDNPIIPGVSYVLLLVLWKTQEMAVPSYPSIHPCGCVCVSVWS